MVARDAGLASSFRSVPDMWHHRVGSTPDDEALRFRDRDGWRSWTWSEVASRVRAVANGLLARGLKAEDRCIVLSPTRVEWILTDLAILCAGGATTTVIPSAPDAHLIHIVDDSEATIVFCGDLDQLRRLQRLRSQLENVKLVVVFDEPPATDDDWVVSLIQFAREGRDFGAQYPEAYTDAHSVIDSDRMATLMYTSGTTGPPKGVVLSHAAWVYEAEAIDALGFLNPTDVHYLWLPLSHVFAKVLELSFIRLGIPTVVDGDSHALMANLASTQPTWMAVVPQTLQRIRNRFESEMQAQGGARLRTYRWALDVGHRYAAALRSGRGPGIALRLQHEVADRLVLSALRERFGRRLRFLICGGAPLPQGVAEYFHAIGVLVLEGYGLTESAAASCVNRLEDPQFGTVGPPLPGCEIRIADDGEIWLRSPGLMSGYWRDTEETARVTTEDGFLMTGDIGTVLPSGHVQITGRKKAIIITAAGKNVAPALFEGLLRSRCPYVEHVVMHGDGRPFCTALITLDGDSIQRWARDRELAFANVADLARHPQVRDVMQGYVDAINRELPAYEQVRRFAILEEPLTVADGLITASGTIRRGDVEERYGETLDALYGSVLRR